MKKIIISAVSISIIFVFSFSAVLASQFRAGQQYTLPEKEVVNENLYTAGANLIINGDIKGDLLVAGQNINVFGNVTDDLWAAGMNLNLNGNVASDLRAAGSFISISGNIAKDTIIFGNLINIAKGTFIGGDVVIAGNEIVVGGDINGKAKIDGNKITINGRLQKGGSIKATGELVIDSGAIIEGRVEYSAPKEAIVMDGAKISGQLIFSKLEARKVRGAFLGFLTVAWLVKLLTTILAALLGYYIFRKRSTALVEQAAGNFWMNVLRGLVLAILIPIVIVICWITIIGLIPGFIGLFLFLLFALLSFVYSGILAGSLLVKYLNKKREFKIDWLVIVGGVIVLRLVSLIPIIGWLIGICFFLASFGSFFYFLYKSFWLERR